MNQTKMKAAFSRTYGGPEVFSIESTDIPQLSDSGIIVKVKATSVTAAQAAIRTGYPLIGRLFLGLLRPKIQISGTDFSGEVVSVGKEVRNFKPGDLVFGSTDIDAGSYAEYLHIQEDAVILKKSDKLSHIDTAALIEGASTSLPFLNDIAEIKKTDHILINGASGSVGTAAVQLAKFYGAKVTAVSSSANHAMLKELGADHVIDYRLQDFTENRGKYDIIFDAVGKSSYGKCKKALKPQGMYLTTVLSFGNLWSSLITSRSKSKKAVFSATGMLPKEVKIRNLKLIKTLMNEGLLKAVVDKVYKLDQIAEAHRYVDTGHKKGNLVITFD